MNEKGIYWESVAEGIVVLVVSLVILFVPALNSCDGVKYIVPSCMIVFYAGRKGLLPCLTALLTWIVCFVIVVYACKKVSSFSMLNFFLPTLACGVVSGLITTLTRKRILSQIVGILIFATLCIIL